MVFTDTIPRDGLVAEYRLEQDIGPDTAGLHNGQIFGLHTIAPGQVANS
jgi:hypothetical protein